MTQRNQASPRIGVCPVSRLVGRALVQVCVQVWKGPAPAGISIWALPRVTPEGREPSMTMSVGIMITDEFPVPTRHSPKAMVLLVPSVTLAIEIGATVNALV